MGSRASAAVLALYFIKWQAYGLRPFREIHSWKGIPLLEKITAPSYKDPRPPHSETHRIVIHRRDAEGAEGPTFSLAVERPAREKVPIAF